LRGEETSWAKPAGTLRVLMLGDSITYGNGVAWNETFSYRLQQILNGAGAAARVEVLNLGVSGYNTAQELATLQELGLRLDPDLVILNICLNDSDPVKQLLGLSLLNKTRISSWRDINLRTVIESSYLLTLLKHRVIALLQNFDGLLSTLNSPSLFLDTRVRETAWADMKADMRAMHELTRQEGIPFAAVIYPYMSQIVAGSDRVPQQDLLAFFDELGVPALDPAPVFESARQDMYNDAYIHLSAYGHQQVAAALADFIRERRLLRGPGAG
jgi:lysophospholipase L1-like esterase